MSNALTKNVPAHIADRIRTRQESGKKSAVADAIVGGDGLAYPRISTRSSRYRLTEGGVETVIGPVLDVVIVGANPRVSKVFYAGQYVQGENAAPSCASSDGLKPDDSVESPVAKACAACPHNALGSKITPSGAKSKMCADQRHMAVVAAADPSKVYGLTVPVSGMKSLREYFKELGSYGLSPEEVVTELGFDEEASYPKIIFKHKGYVPEKVIQLVDEISHHDSVKVATRQALPNATLASPAPAAPAIEEKVTVEDAYEEEEQAPTPVKPPKKKKPQVEPVKASDDLAANIAALFDGDE